MKFSFVFGKNQMENWSKKNVIFDINIGLTNYLISSRKKFDGGAWYFSHFFHLNWIFLTKTPSRNSTNWSKQICRWWFRFSFQLLMKFTPSKGKMVEAFPCVLLIRTNREIYSTNFIPAINEFDFLETWRDILYWFWNTLEVF